MKKMIAILLTAVLCLSLAACGEQKSPAKQPATADVVKAVSAQVTFLDEMMVADDKVVSNFYDVDPAKVAEKTMFVSSSRTTAEELTVFKAASESDVDAIKAAMETRIEDQKLAYENYVPAEMTKLNSAVIYSSGSYVILAIADDVSNVEKTFLAQF